MTQKSNRLVLTIAIILAIIVGGKLTWDHLFPSATLRYRMTVEVETPQGLRSGSSVIESTISDGLGMGDSSGIGYGLKGEAVAVDVSDGKTLFALLTDGGDGAGYHAHLLNESLADGAIASPSLPRKYAPHEWAEERKAARRIKPKITLQPEHYPTLVFFRDIKEPDSEFRQI